MTASRSEQSPLTQYQLEDFSPLLASYERHLKAGRMRPATLSSYLTIPARFHAFGADNGFPKLGNLRREHVETWLADIADQGRSSHTQRAYFVFLRQWFRWLEEEGEIRRNPMERMKTPSTDEVEKDVLTEEEMSAVLATLQKAKNWRDLALVSLLYDTGMRSSETSNLLVDDVDFGSMVIRLRGTETKGRRGRIVPFSSQCAAHMDRYLRKRTDTLPWLFVGQKGQLQRSGMYLVIRRAFASTGRTIGPHDIRHTSASHTAGLMSVTDQMQTFGWATEHQARHYSAQVAQANAIAAHRKASPLERLGR